MSSHQAAQDLLGLTGALEADVVVVQHLYNRAGRSIVPMFVMMIVWCGVRVTYISIVIRIIPVINVIYWAYPLTWFISSMIFLILFLKTDWIHGLEKQ